MSISYLSQLSQQILRDMHARKVRSLLAIFGITWGTIAVVLLLSLGNGFYQANRESMLSLADSTIIYWAGRTSKAYHGMPPGARIHIKAADVMSLAKVFPDIQYISPVTGQRRLSVIYQGKMVRSPIAGVGSQYQRMRQLPVQSGGRFINPLDVAKGARVIFLGSQLKQRLFGLRSALAKQVIVNKMPFLVIGVLSDDGIHGRWIKREAFIPYTAGKQLWGDVDVNDFFVSLYNVNKIPQFQRDLQRYLANKYHFSPQDHNAVMSFNLAKLKQFFLMFFLGIQLFLGFCGAMTLGVGAVGVANIMFLVVTERTKEIGLRMALGARQSHIMLQILLEAGLIVLIAGVLGFLISVATLFVLQQMTLPHWLGHPTLSWPTVGVTFVVLAIVALAAGFFPARRAAKMEPVEALAF